MKKGNTNRRGFVAIALLSCATALPIDTTMAAPGKAMAPPPAAAKANAPGPVSRAQKRETCAAYSFLARSIMGARQKGASMAEMMELADTELAENLVVAAFEQPRMSVEANQERAIRDFENEVYLGCVQGLND